MTLTENPKSESAPENSQCVRETHRKLSPNEQPQGPLNEEEHDYQNYD